MLTEKVWMEYCVEAETTKFDCGEGEEPGTAGHVTFKSFLSALVLK